MFSPMKSVSQSIAWWCFVPEKLTPERFVKSAAEAGFSAIDLVPPDYWSLVSDHGLAISAIAAHQPLTIGFNRCDQHDRLEHEVRMNITHAQRLGIRNLICFSGNRDGLDDAQGIKNTAAGLSRLAPFAEDGGVTLVLELLNSKVDHPDYQADHTRWGTEVCQRVSSPRVKLLYDIYHMQIMEGDIIRTIRAAHGMIGHYHTAGNPGRNELDSTQELFYPAILQAIKETGYTGYIAHEFVPKGDPVTSLRTAFQQCASYL
jgi:hydroxypyruvate isomerase